MSVTRHLLSETSDTALIFAPGAQVRRRRRDSDGAVAMCADGPLSTHDIARAARCSVKEVMRGIRRYATEKPKTIVDKDKQGVTFEMTDIPDPKTQSVAAMARVVASRLGLTPKQIEVRSGARPGTIGSVMRGGKSVPIRKLQATADATGLSMEEIRPDLGPGELLMAKGFPGGHIWRDGTRGRALTTKQEPGSQHRLIARLTCTCCSAIGETVYRTLPGPTVIDKKFKEKGWKLDPAKCPHCQARKEKTDMALPATPTPASVQAQARMFNLLNIHFTPDSGTYGGGGWSDQKIADEVGLAVTLVAAVRAEAFGPLKEPPEIAALTADITALEQLLRETIAPIETELTALKQRAAELRRKFAA